MSAHFLPASHRIPGVLNSSAAHAALFLGVAVLGAAALQAQTQYTSSQTIAGWTQAPLAGFTVSNGAVVTVDSTGVFSPPASGTGARTATIGNSGSGGAMIVQGIVSGFTDGYIATGAGSTGSLTVTGSGSWSSKTLFVGYDGSATLTVADHGSVWVNSGLSTLYVAAQTGSTGTVNIGGAANAAAAAAGTIAAFAVDGGSGTATLQFNTTGTTYFTQNGLDSGTGVRTSGSLSLVNTAGTNVFLSDLNHAGGTTINGGTVQIGNGGTSGTIAGDIANHAALVFNRSDASYYTSVISGTGTLTKQGAGTLFLTNASTYTGQTTISGGTLALSGSGSVADTTKLTLASGATFDVSGLSGGYTLGSAQALVGQGTVAGDLTVNGSLDAGDVGSVGTLTFSNNLTLGSTATTTFDLGTSSDAITVAGQLTYGGTLVLDFASAASPAAYQLFTAGSTVGDFATVSLEGLYSGALANASGSWTYADAISGYTFNFSEATGALTVSAVPEPATFAALAGLAALGLVIGRRRLRARKP